MDSAAAVCGPVVVAFDGSPRAEHALDWAALAAAGRGTSLVIASTTWWPAVFEPAALAVRLVPDACVDEAVAAVTEAWPALEVSGVEAGGAGEVLGCAAELDAALLVVAADAGIPVRGLVRGAAVPIAFAGGPVGGGPVVVGIDAWRIRPAKLAFAFDLANAAGQEVHILHTGTRRWRGTAARAFAGFAVAELGDWLVSYPDVAVRYEFTTAGRTSVLARRARAASLLVG